MLCSRRQGPLLPVFSTSEETEVQRWRKAAEGVLGTASCGGRAYALPSAAQALALSASQGQGSQGALAPSPMRGGRPLLRRQHWEISGPPGWYFLLGAQRWRSSRFTGPQGRVGQGPLAVQPPLGHPRDCFLAASAQACSPRPICSDSPGSSRVCSSVDPRASPYVPAGWSSGRGRGFGP